MAYLPGKQKLDEARARARADNIVSIGNLTVTYMKHVLSSDSTKMEPYRAKVIRDLKSNEYMACCSCPHADHAGQRDHTVCKHLSTLIDEIEQADEAPLTPELVMIVNIEELKEYYRTGIMPTVGEDGD